MHGLTGAADSFFLKPEQIGTTGIDDEKNCCVYRAGVSAGQKRVNVLVLARLTPTSYNYVGRIANGIEPPAPRSGWSIRSLDHPIDNWPASTAAVKSAPVRKSRPARAASPALMMVTPAVGTGWVDNIRARTTNPRVGMPQSLYTS